MLAQSSPAALGAVSCPLAFRARWLLPCSACPAVKQRDGDQSACTLDLLSSGWGALVIATLARVPL